MRDEIQAQAAKVLATELEKMGLPAAAVLQRSWNAKEIWQLIIQTFVTPLTLGAFSFFLSDKVDKAQQGFMTHLQGQTQQSQHKRKTEETERQQREQSQALLAKRLWLWDQVAQDLYDINCYLQILPTCRGIAPEDIFSRRQHCEFVLSAYHDFFPEEVRSSYRAFAEAAFEIPSDPRAQIKLKASFRDRPREKKKPKPIYFVYAKDVNAAAAQRKIIGDRWETLRAAMSRMIQPQATNTPNAGSTSSAQTRPPA